MVQNSWALARVTSYQFPYSAHSFSLKMEHHRKSLHRRLGGPRACLNAFEKRKISCHCQQSNPVSSAIQPVARCYIDRTIPWITRIHSHNSFVLYTGVPVDLFKKVLRNLFCLVFFSIHFYFFLKFPEQNFCSGKLRDLYLVIPRL
jgi:hypothetical protein